MKRLKNGKEENSGYDDASIVGAIFSGVEVVALYACIKNHDRQSDAISTRVLYFDTRRKKEGYGTAW